MRELGNTFDFSTRLGGGIEGVLFDIDDTLVDLRSAAIDAFHAMVDDLLEGVTSERLRLIAEDFADDGAGAYERYMAGEVTFLGQRQLRLNRAFELVEHKPLSEQSYLRWAEGYETLVKDSWKPFDDVLPHLAALSSWGIPYGAVSNNVEAYQRMKLVRSGLSGFAVVIGSDTAGAPKPDPAPFLAGCSQLQTAPGRTLYVGDNPINDVQGAENAGLIAIFVDRESKHAAQSALTVSNLEQLTALIGQSINSLE
ncbi:HAD family hydrolase [Arthrobacter sp. MYb213]|uniref:HAD family hydrolase n=1 Tax=Arthrobacter sp. MYb213 TaxID=1848595 RepID=UPI000CFDAED4|nr:HAD family hydrolase [Arthrobacter sp. MYb213]PRB72719.1 haloacid dehalogenase [Arthrobacter sp. MYb213]